MDLVSFFKLKFEKNSKKFKLLIAQKKKKLQSLL